MSLGEHYEHGEGVGWLPDRAIKLYEKACAAGYAEGCRQAGVFSLQGHALLQPDHEKAVRYLRKACDLGLSDACMHLATLYRNEPGERDRRKAVVIYRTACDAHSAEACLALARMYRTGDGVSVDRKKSSSLLRRGCDDGSGQACLLLGEHYFVGWGVPLDSAKGVSLLRKACAMRVSLACDALSSPGTAGESSASRTREAWNQLVAAPSAVDIAREKIKNNELLAKRLNAFRNTYRQIECRGADPELCRYIEAWDTWAVAAIDLCEREQRHRSDAEGIEGLAGLLGGVLQKNERGDRDSASVENGMAKGRGYGRIVAELLGASERSQLLRDGKSLGEVGLELANYQDVLALRLEMTYHVFLPPPKSAA